MDGSCQGNLNVHPLTHTIELIKFYFAIIFKDVDELASKLGNLAGKFRISDAKFNHLDFTYATDADKLVYNRVISLMNDN